MSAVCVPETVFDRPRCPFSGTRLGCSWTGGARSSAPPQPLLLLGERHVESTVRVVRPGRLDLPPRCLLSPVERPCLPDLAQHRVGRIKRFQQAFLLRVLDARVVLLALAVEDQRVVAVP